MGLLAKLKQILAPASSSNSSATIVSEPIVSEPIASEPIESTSGTDAGMEMAGAHWGQRAREQIEQTRPGSWTECPIVIAEYMNPLISGKAEVGWLEAVARAHFPVPVAQALSLGCGGGGLERHGLQLRIADRFDAYDVSAEAVALAQQLAQDSGQSDQINYAVANLNTLEFNGQQYGAVFASQSLHHIEALEHYLEQVQHALTPGGLFIFNEFIGPNQFQWTEAQLHHANRLLALVPEAMRQLVREPGFKHSIARPTVEYMNSYDPTEAIRSAEIMPAVERYFTILSRKDFGGTLLHLVLDNIAANLNESDEGLRLLRHFFEEEQRLIASGELTSDFTVVVARKY